VIQCSATRWYPGGCDWKKRHASRFARKRLAAAASSCAGSLRSNEYNSARRGSRDS
jgi:hypothetical protein